MTTFTRFPLKLFFKDRIVLISVILSLVINLGMWIYLPLSILHKDRLVFLHYTVHFGVDYAGAWNEIFNIPLAGLMLLLFNLFLAYWLYNNKYLSRVLVVAGAVMQLILLGQAMFLVFLNF